MEKIRNMENIKIYDFTNGSIAIDVKQGLIITLI